MFLNFKKFYTYISILSFIFLVAFLSLTGTPVKSIYAQTCGQTYTGSYSDCWNPVTNRYNVPNPQTIACTNAGCPASSIGSCNTTSQGCSPNLISGCPLGEFLYTCTCTETFACYATPSPTPTPTCTIGASCSTCTQTCGTEFRTCQYLQYPGGQYCTPSATYQLSCGLPACSTPTPRPTATPPGSTPRPTATPAPTPVPTAGGCNSSNCTGADTYACSGCGPSATCEQSTTACRTVNGSLTCNHAPHAPVGVGSCGSSCGAPCPTSSSPPTPAPTATPTGGGYACGGTTCMSAANGGTDLASCQATCNSSSFGCAYCGSGGTCQIMYTNSCGTNCSSCTVACGPSYNEQIAPVNSYSVDGWGRSSVTTWGNSASIVVSATGSGSFGLTMNNSCGSNATINSVTVPFANYYTGGTTYPTYTASGTYCSSDSFSSPATRLACPSAITQCTSAGSTNCTVQTFTDTKTGNNNCRTSSGQTASTYSSSCTVKGTQAGGGYGAAITPSFNGCSLPADFTACSVGGNNVPLGLYTATVNSTNSVPNKTFPLSVYVVNPSELNYTCGFYSRYNSNSQTYTQYNILTVKFKDFGGIYYCAYSNDNAYSDANPLACASGAGNGTSTDTITINSIANGIHNLNVLGWKSVGGNYQLIGAMAEAINIVINNGVCTVAPPAPSPTPIPTPTPTLTPAGSNVISGNVFVDANKNQLLDNGESDYSAGTSTINIYQGSQVSGSLYQTIPTNNGIFTTGNVLPVGTYTVAYSGLPNGYQITVPVNGPPPSFTVTLGPGCSVGGSPSASCDSSGNITNLNYGITNSIPWCQFTGGGNVGADGGFVCNCSGSNCIIPNPTPPGGGGGGGSTCIYDVDCSGGLTCNTSGSTCACSVGGTPGTCTTGTGGAGGGNTGGGGTGGTGDGGFTDNIPPTAIAACGGPYASIPGSTATTPGLIFTGIGSAYFGQGSASLNNWLVGGTNYPDTFGPIAQGGFVKTSYAYLQSIAKQAGITPTDILPFCGSGGLSNCNLDSSTFPHGIYIANGDLTLTGNGTSASYTFSLNQGFIILINGNLLIQTQLHVPVGSTALFSASGNITVDKSVGEGGPLGYQSANSDIEGVFSADQSFIIDGQNDCTIEPDLKLNVAGSIVTDAALNGGTFINKRDLCANNIYCPVFTIQSRPDFILNAPDFIKKANYTWQEVAP